MVSWESGQQIFNGGFGLGTDENVFNEPVVNYNECRGYHDVETSSCIHVAGNINSSNISVRF